MFLVMIFRPGVPWCGRSAGIGRLAGLLLSDWLSGVAKENRSRPKNTRALLTDAVNPGQRKMAEGCPGTSTVKASWLSAWHLRTKNDRKSLAGLVNYHRRPPFAACWGEGATFSSDEQPSRKILTVPLLMDLPGRAGR